MKTSSQNDFLNGKQIIILKALEEYPEGISTNKLFDQVKKGMAKHTFVKTLNELEGFKIIERIRDKNRKLIRYSQFLRIREEIVNKQKAGLKETLDSLTNNSKHMRKEAKKKFLFREFAKFSLLLSEFMGTNMMANSSYFKNDKLLAWANLQSFDTLKSLNKDVKKTLRKEFGTMALRDFSEYQSGKFQKYISSKIADLEKMSKKRK